jgi:hypothetical protein
VHARCLLRSDAGRGRRASRRYANAMQVEREKEERARIKARRALKGVKKVIEQMRIVVSLVTSPVYETAGGRCVG